MTDPARHSRQVRFRPFGQDGQARLGAARALIVGLGALGSGLAEALVRAGVGSLVLVDRDIVDASNLQRQTLYATADADAGRPKADAAAARLAAIDPATRLEPLAQDFTPAVFDSIERPDLVLDGTDNFATRYLINDLCLRAGIPWIYGGAVGAHGTAMVVRPGVTPCFRCVLPIPPATGATPTCETAGVLLPAVQAVTSFQSVEALKILGGKTAAITRGVVMWDLWNHRHDHLMRDATPNPNCPTCNGTAFPALEQDWSQSVSLCGRDVVQVHPRAGSDVDIATLAENLGDAVTARSLARGMLRFEVEGHRFSVFPGGRTLIFGTDDVARARILYDRYVGG